jgi:hypothetical protein
MLTYHSLFLHEYKKLIKEEIDRTTDILASGNAILDYAAYKHHVGILRGLYKALELCEEAESSANQDR